MHDDLMDINEWFKKQREKEKLLQEKYPDNVPNDVCKHAFIYGLSIENSFKPKVGEYHHLFSTPYEDIYVWTYEKDTNSSLVSLVNPSIKIAPFGKQWEDLFNFHFRLLKLLSPQMSLWIINGCIILILINLILVQLYFMD